MRFFPDRRAQSVQIGVMLVFVVLVIAFAGYQAVAVPQQNSATEYNHDRLVHSQFTDVRSSIMNAAASGKSSFSELTLGTQYSMRILAINPPNPTGTVRTTTPGSIEVEGDGAPPSPFCLGSDEARHLEYRATYNEYRGNPVYRFENTVAYREFDEGTVRVDSDQRLLNDRSVNLVPIQGSFFRSGTDSVAIDPVPGLTRSRTVSNPIVRVPTELGSEEWNELLESELDPGETASVDDGQLTLELDGSYRVVCAPTGINAEPASGQRLGGGLGDGSIEDESINPSGSRDVVLQDVGIVAGTGNRNVELRFRNRGDEDRSFERARLALYYAPGTGPGSQAQEELQLLDTGDVLELRGPMVDLSESIVIPAGGTETITVRFPDGAAGDLLGLNFVDDQDFEALYLTGIEGTLDEDPTEETGPAIQDVTIADNSGDSSPGTRAEYAVTVDVDHGETLDRIEVRFDGETDQDTQTETVQQPTYTFEYEGGPNTIGNSYDIVVEVYNGDDVLTDSQTVTDVADGTDP